MIRWLLGSVGTLVAAIWTADAVREAIKRRAWLRSEDAVDD